MVELTNPDSFKSLDPKDVYGSTGMLSLQCKQIWEDTKKVVFPQEYKTVESIVITGMGGSAYGGHVVKALFKKELKIPLFVNSDYSLPGFVNEKTLVVVTSYSGSTEESLENAKMAKEKGAKILGLTTGGKLGEFMTINNYPALIFNSNYNPSNQPRLGTGYIILGTIALLTGLSLLDVTDSVVTDAIAELSADQELIKSTAIDLAKKIQGFVPIIFAAEFLEGNAHIMRNQFNETSKSFSSFSDLPELNHHLLEGFKNPTDKKLTILGINSFFYSDVLKKRFQLTKEVILKQGMEFAEYQAMGHSKLSQVFNVLSLGGYITVYLSFLYGLDPSLIPWVDYFKAELAK